MFLDEPSILNTAAFQVLQFGILGVVCLAFAAVIWLLWKQNNKLHDTLVALQETRVNDAKATAKAYADLSEKATVAMLNQTAATQDTNEALHELRVAMQNLPVRR